MRDLLPDMPEEILRKLTLVQLVALTNWIVEELKKDPNVQMAMSLAKKNQ
jgi:hypothetical protein